MWSALGLLTRRFRRALRAHPRLERATLAYRAVTFRTSSTGRVSCVKPSRYSDWHRGKKQVGSMVTMALSHLPGKSLNDWEGKQTPSHNIRIRLLHDSFPASHPAPPP